MSGDNDIFNLMIHSKLSFNNSIKITLNKALLLGVSSSVLLLSACDNGSKLANINDAFSKSWDQIADKDPDYIVNDVSHMDKRKSNIQIAKTNNSVMEAPAGSTKNLFGRQLNGDEARLDRLERAVQDMRNDFDRVEPAILRLMEIEGDIQNLVSELEQLNQSAAPAAPMRTTSAPVMPPKTTAKAIASPSSKGFVKKSAPANTGKPVVYDLRVGEHSDKTRIVMDVNAKTGFNVDIDNTERIMVVDLPNANWNSRMSQNFGKSPFISSYKVEPSGNGHIVIFQLKKNASVGYKADLKGFEGTSRRLVIDVTN